MAPIAFQTTETLRMSSTIFWGTFIFMLAGLVGGFRADLIAPEQWSILSDCVTASILVVVGALVWRRKIQPETGLLIFLVEVLRNFYLFAFIAGLYDPHYQHNYDESMKLLLITSLIGAVLGLVVNKKALPVFCALAVVVQLFFIWINPSRPVFSDLIIEDSCIIIGSLMVVYYYRSMLERLMVDLSDSFTTTKGLQENLERLNEQNRPFVVFGKNTAGLVHDFRNDVNAIHLNIQTMQLRHSRGIKPSTIELDAVERALSNLNDRIAKVKYLTGARVDQGHELLDIQRVVESALYPFLISPELRHAILFETHCDGKVETWGTRIAYLQIIENILRNSCEAIIAESRDVQGKVGINISGFGGFVTLLFYDNGSGISFCKKNNSGMECELCNCFAIGKSTKSYGSGYGMINILQSVKELGGTVGIRSGSQGTTIRVRLPQLTAPEVPVLRAALLT